MRCSAVLSRSVTLTCARTSHLESSNCIQEGCIGEVELEDDNADALNIMLRFFYYGKARLDNWSYAFTGDWWADEAEVNRLSQLILVADKYQVSTLKKLCMERTLETVEGSTSGDELTSVLQVWGSLPAELLDPWLEVIADTLQYVILEAMRTKEYKDLVAVHPLLERALLRHLVMKGHPEDTAYRLLCLTCDTAFIGAGPKTLCPHCDDKARQISQAEFSSGDWQHC